MASARAIAATFARLPLVSQPLARENHNEQRIKAIPKKSASSTKMQNLRRPAPICPQFLGSVNRP
jgi:hypothetical protein